MADNPFRFRRRQLLTLSAMIAVGLACCAPLCAEMTSFVAARGDKLFVDDDEFRFMSFNIPNLHLVEDNFSFTNPNPWRWPDEFEVRDALDSIRQMGGNATRIYVLSVRREGSDMGEHVFVRGPGDFNEEAFCVLDKVLQIANEKGIRVIIPLVDNWHWWGGRAEYAKFRGKSPDDFWSDEQVISDFEQTIRFTLNRVNTLTGIAYKDDPAIFGWETGNELDSTPKWTRRISEYIKSLDKNHLVIDGYALHGVRQDSLDDPNIDVITTHHYPNTDTDYVSAILKAHSLTAGKKPYFVGEFGFAAPQELERVMDTIIKKGISGGMLWSLRFHNRDGGFYWHSEPSGENLYKAYHWPGFETGETYHETRILQTTRRKAFEIQGLPVPPASLPLPPKLLPIADVSEISWQGSTGAARYDVQRSSSAEGPWETVGVDISDAAVQYRPLFSDENAEIGGDYFYRVAAKNEAGGSPPSNIVGPVKVTRRTLVDECKDFGKLYHRSEEIRVLSLQARKTQEDVHRFEMPPGGKMVYEAQGPIKEWRILLFNTKGGSVPTITLSADGKQFSESETRQQPIPVGTSDYGYKRPVLLSGSASQANLRFLSIDTSALDSAIEVSRVEISSVAPAQPEKSSSDSSTRGAQLSPSILMFHKPHHTDGASYVRRAAALGNNQVNVVVTLHCDINKANEVLSFGMRRRGRYVPLNPDLLAELKQSLKEVLAEVVANEMELSVLAHLNAGGKNYEWRNHFLFDPIAYYQGYSYQGSIIKAVSEALAETPGITSPVDLALAGEMGRSVFAYPASYEKIIEELRADKRLPEMKIGISFNFHNAAGESKPTPRQRVEAQRLINLCDFVGLSNYCWFDLPIDSRDFTLSTQAFLEEMRESGAAIPLQTPLHFSEVGVGGGTDKGLATTPQEASRTPWNGSGHPRRNPWKSAEMKRFRVEYHSALLEYLAHPSASNPVTKAYLWSEGSWDPMDTTDKGFADPKIIKMIQTHNAEVSN